MQVFHKWVWKVYASSYIRYLIGAQLGPQVLCTFSYKEHDDSYSLCDLGHRIGLYPHIWNLSLLSVDDHANKGMEPITEGTIHILHPLAQWRISPFSRPLTSF